MKQIQLNGALIQAGFQIDNNGFLAKYTEYGRRRKHWKSSCRGKSRQFLKENCETCGLGYRESELTIHHKIPLRHAIVITEENCQTLCRPCHDEEEFRLNGVASNKKPSEKKRFSRMKKENIKEQVVKRRIKKATFVKGLWGEYRIA